MLGLLGPNAKSKAYLKNIVQSLPAQEGTPFR